jgi:hypothetical protein
MFIFCMQHAVGSNRSSSGSCEQARSLLGNNHKSFCFHLPANGAHQVPVYLKLYAVMSSLSINLENGPLIILLPSKSVVVTLSL